MPAPPPDPHTATLARALERNIQALVRRKAVQEHETAPENRLADAITRFAGSMRFVYLHLVIFGIWILSNLGLVPGVPRWDPSLVILAMAASVEAIFLSTFVLISQNRMQAADEKRADLDLQISLLNEHETTRLLRLVSSIAERLGVDTLNEEELRELENDVPPEAVLDRLEAEDERLQRRD
jgi:uncharacterized membrane protein